MKKHLLTLISGLIITFSACKKDSNNDKVESKFKGSWSGTYSGDDKGAIAVDVDANGNLKGTSISSKTIEVFALTGTVDANGVFKGSTEAGADFTGTFTQSSVNGTWINTKFKLSGTWTGNKK